MNNYLIQDFESSKEYKEALKKFLQKLPDALIYEHSFHIEDEGVCIFYQQDKVDAIFKEIMDAYENSDNILNKYIDLGSVEPEIKQCKFMGIKYKVIFIYPDRDFSFFKENIIC